MTAVLLPCLSCVALLAGSVLTADHAAQAPVLQTITVRGQRQSLHIYGTRGAPPVPL